MDKGKIIGQNCPKAKGREMFEEFLRVAVTAAKTAGNIQREKLGRIGFREKGWADLVTEADTASQEAIFRILRESFPTHALLGEEPGEGLLSEEACGTASPSGNPYTWIVDPLDGTTNFVHGVPLFGPSIALARGNELLCGVIFNPMSEELYTATQGGGAFLNGEKLAVSGVTDLEHALASVSFPTKTEADSPDFLTFLVMLAETQAIRRIGSTALNLAFLAAGRFDVLSCQSAHAWDVAAGVLLVQEAGGVVTGPGGRSFDLATPGVLAAATDALHDELLEAIAGA